MVLIDPAVQAPAQAAAWVLHVVPPNGGGVDRFVRDLCRHRPDDWILHASDTQFVLERPAVAAFVPLAPGALADLAFAGALGRPLAVHAHSTVGAVRQVCEMLCASTGAPCVLTLHDIGFADPAAAAFERQQRLRFARAAAARTAPSDYIVDLVRRELGEGCGCSRVENGVQAWPDPAAERAACAACATNAPRDCAIAVIGAIGEHKGLVELLELSPHLPPDLRIVILGYTAQQLLPGWVVPQRIWMHGVFEPEQLPDLVAYYGVRMAFFPPGMPESYSYALSDAWMAGLPVLAPDQGALAERLQRHGGGRLYAPRLPAADMAALLTAVASGALAGSTAPPAVSALTSVQEMVDAMNSIYQSVAGQSADAPTDQASIDSLAQQQLDTQFFRKELLHLQNLLAAQAQGRLELDQRACELERALAAQTQRANDAERLRQDLAGLRQAHDQLESRVQSAVAAQAALGQANAALQKQCADLMDRYQVLQQRHAALTSKLAAPLQVLPAAWRHKLVQLGRRWLI